MSPPLDELYLEWLYSQVAGVGVKNPSHTYWKLFRKLFTKEFIWIVPNDDNRREDGKELRHEFIETLNLRSVDHNWMHLGCSMLELLIGLARRLSFQAEGEPRSWFWKLIENLGLEQYNDNVRLPEERIDAILDRVIWRNYEPNGVGGLFPLTESTCADQREVELWYQMNSYLLERA